MEDLLDCGDKGVPWVSEDTYNQKLMHWESPRGWECCTYFWFSCDHTEAGLANLEGMYEWNSKTELNVMVLVMSVSPVFVVVFHLACSKITVS